MFSGNQTQWSKIKKHLEDSICDKLKDRVTYFATSYRHAHDGQGRVCLLVDKKEILNMPFTNQWGIFDEMDRLRRETDISYYDAHTRATYNISQTGVLSTWVFSTAYDEFCTKSIEECLSSENYLTRVIAFLDKRTGRRTLEKMKESIKELPEWLQYFYNLRVSTYDK